MRVIHLVIGGDSGGAKTHILTLLNQLKEKIHIELVCLTDGILYDQAVAMGIPTILMKQKSRFDFSVIRKLRKHIEDESIDLLHCHGARANLVGALLKGKLNIPFITTVHSDYTLDFAHHWYKDMIFTRLNRYSLNRCDYYLSVTKVFKELLLEQGFDGKKIKVIYNGVKIPENTMNNKVNPDEQEGILSGNEDKDKEVVKSDYPVFGCITRFVPIKGTHILLEALKICLEKGYHLKLRIAGSGEGAYADGLYSFVQDNKLNDSVEFVGYVHDMDAFYQSIDVSILPSLTESFPYALLESGARGIAPLASKAGGIIEMIEDKVTGRLFEVEDAEGLAMIIIELLENNALVKTYGTAFYEKVISDFSDLAMAKRHVDLYKEMILPRQTEDIHRDRK